MGGVQGIVAALHLAGRGGERTTAVCRSVWPVCCSSPLPPPRPSSLSATVPWAPQCQGPQAYWPRGQEAILDWRSDYRPAAFRCQLLPSPSPCFLAVPTRGECPLDSAFFWVARLPLPLACGHRFDALGDHRSACPARCAPVVAFGAGSCLDPSQRKAGASPLTPSCEISTFRLEASMTASASWWPPMDFLCGAGQLAVDTTLVSALDSAGRARVYHEGAALRIVRRAKERTYHELVSSD